MKRALMFAALLAALPGWAGEFPALLDWSGRVNLSLPVSGILDSVAVQPGQRVKKGEVLASLEATVLKANVAEAKAESDRLGEELADAQRDADRVQELYNRTVSATTELDAAKLRLARAQSGQAAAQARLERARRLLADSEVRAPFDAIVLARPGEPGLVITAQCQPATVVSVARSDQLLARVQLTANQASGLTLGKEAEVQVAGHTLTGRLTGLTAQADGRYAAEVSIPRQSGLLGGQAATVRLP